MSLRDTMRKRQMSSSSNFATTLRRPTKKPVPEKSSSMAKDMEYFRPALTPPVQHEDILRKRQFAILWIELFSRHFGCAIPYSPWCERARQVCLPQPSARPQPTQQGTAGRQRGTGPNKWDKTWDHHHAWLEPLIRIHLWTVAQWTSQLLHITCVEDILYVQYVYVLYSLYVVPRGVGQPDFLIFFTDTPLF